MKLEITTIISSYTKTPSNCLKLYDYCLNIFSSVWKSITWCLNGYFHFNCLKIHCIIPYYLTIIWYFKLFQFFDTPIFDYLLVLDNYLTLFYPWKIHFWCLIIWLLFDYYLKLQYLVLHHLFKIRELVLHLLVKGYFFATGINILKNMFLPTSVM